MTEMQDAEQTRTEQPISGWAAGGITFAACVLVLIGAFQIIAGLAAIFEDEFYVVTQNYAFDLDVSAWGWIHLLLGVLLVVTGFGLFSPLDVGGRDRAGAGDAERRRQLLLHPVLPLLVHRRDRPRHVGHLGADPAGCDPNLTTFRRPIRRRPLSGRRRSASRSSSGSGRCSSCWRSGCWCCWPSWRSGRCSRSSSPPCSRSGSIRSSAHSCGGGGSADARRSRCSRGWPSPSSRSSCSPPVRCGARSSSSSNPCPSTGTS